MDSLGLLNLVGESSDALMKVLQGVKPEDRIYAIELICSSVYQRLGIGTYNFTVIHGEQMTEDEKKEALADINHFFGLTPSIEHLIN